MYLFLHPAVDDRFAVEGLDEDSATVTAILRPVVCSAERPRCHQPSVHVQSWRCTCPRSCGVAPVTRLL
jgi:hypothetical protein